MALGSWSLNKQKGVVSTVGYGMDEAEQDQYEARLKELFDSFDPTGSGSLGREELTDLCHVLHLEEVAPGALQQTLLQDSLLDRVRLTGRGSRTAAYSTIT
ncbi:UNVERIFIED_CONTAM: hypothetical protein K2H54_009838 [Gekko kuhli]